MNERNELIAGLVADISAVNKGWRNVLNEDDCWVLVDGHDRAEHRVQHGIHLCIEWLRLDTLSRVVRYRVEPCARFFIDRGEREHLLPQRLHVFAKRCIANGEKALAQLNSLSQEAA